MTMIKKALISSLIGGSLFWISLTAESCTRVVYQGNNQTIITARSMDWKQDVGTNLWILPSGVKRSGNVGKNSIHWTSKYGSVVATGYDISTTDVSMKQA
jgi:choloylglycine hydrolase